MPVHEPFQTVLFFYRHRLSAASSLVLDIVRPTGHHRRPRERSERQLLLADLWPRLFRPALCASRSDHAGERRPTPPRVGVHNRRRQSRIGSDAADPRRRDVPLRGRLARLRARRAHGREAMELRPRALGRVRARLLLWLDQSRRRPLGRARLRRHDGRPHGRARQEERRRRLGDDRHRLAARLQHHGSASRGEGHGPHGRRRRRVRHPRLRQSFRRKERRAAVDGLYHPRPRRTRQRNMARRHMEEWRRTDLDDGCLRPGVEPRLLEHGQRRTVELPRAQGRQQMDRLDDRHRRR